MLSLSPQAIKVIKHPGKVFEVQYKHFAGYGSNLEQAYRALLTRVIVAYEKLSKNYQELNETQFPLD